MRASQMERLKMLKETVDQYIKVHTHTDTHVIKFTLQFIRQPCVCFTKINLKSQMCNDKNVSRSVLERLPKCLNVSLFLEIRIFSCEYLSISVLKSHTLTTLTIITLTIITHNHYNHTHTTITNTYYNYKHTLQSHTH